MENNAEFVIGVNKKQAMMLWQMVNSPAIAVAVSEAETAAEVYRMAKAAALYHEIIKE